MRKFQINRHMMFFIALVSACALLWIFATVNAMFLFLGIVSGLLFFNVTLSTMTNVLTGAMVQPNDTFWRMLLLFTSALFITLSVFV